MDFGAGGGDGGGDLDFFIREWLNSPLTSSEDLFQRFKRSMKAQGRIKCPVCMKEHKSVRSGKKSVCRHVSHNSIQIFVAAPCPICLEDLVQPPNIALPCGHVVCTYDFRQIGGRVDVRSNEEESESDSDMENEERLRQEFYDFLRASGSAPAMPAEQSATSSYDVRDVIDSGEEIEPEELLSSGDEIEQEEFASHGSMPDLEHDSEEDVVDQSDRSMPVLLARPDEGSSSGTDDDVPGLGSRHRENDDDSSSDGSMPGLVPRIAGFAVGQDDSSSDGSLPYLNARFGQNGNDYRSSDGSIPGLVNRYDAGYDDSDSDGPPPLLRREAQSSDDDSDTPRTTSRQFSGSGVYLVDRTAGVGVIKWADHRRAVAISSTWHLEPGDRLIPSTNEEGLWLTKTNGMVILYNTTTNAPMRGYQVDANVQMVSDGEVGIWTVKDMGENKILECYNNEYPEGKEVRTLSAQTTLIQGGSNSTWAHVKHGNSAISAGLWFFKPTGQKHVRGATEISATAKIVPDGSGALWVLDSVQGTTRITHIARTDRRPYTSHQVPCDFLKDTKLITSTNSSVFLHTRQNNAWALFLWKDNALQRLKPCPKDAKIVADREGNAWVMQKERRERILFKVTGYPSTVVDIPHRHPAGTEMTGAF